MALALFPHPFKVSLNALKNSVRFALAELLGEPLHGIVMVFGVIASLLPLAKWNHIFWDSAETFRATQWYPVIHCQRMPQTARTTAYSTTMIEVIKSTPPIGVGKRVRQIALAGATTLNNSQRFVRVCCSPFVSIVSCVFCMGVTPSSLLISIASGVFISDCSSSIGVALSPFSTTSEFVLGVRFAIFTCLLCYCFTIGVVICTRSCVAPLRIAVIVPVRSLLDLIAMGFIVALILSMGFLWIVAPLATCGVTDLTFGTYTIKAFLLFVKELGSGGLFNTAFGASFKRRNRGIILNRHGGNLTLSHSPTTRNRAGAFISPQLYHRLEGFEQ